jgi:Nickel responsive protein SCO4226-like
MKVKTFLIEREIPGASELSDEDLRGITSTSNDAVETLNKPYKWLHSYVAGDKVYCVHQAEDAEVIREHAKTGGFPANLVAEVVSVFDSSGPRDLPS